MAVLRHGAMRLRDLLEKPAKERNVAKHVGMSMHRAAKRGEGWGGEQREYHRCLSVPSKEEHKAEERSRKDTHLKAYVGLRLFTGRLPRRGHTHPTIGCGEKRSRGEA